LRRACPARPPLSYDANVTIGADLQRARLLSFSDYESAAQELLLSLMPAIVQADRDDLFCEVCAQLGEIYLTRGATEGAEDCMRRIRDCLAAYEAVLAGVMVPDTPLTLSTAEIESMNLRYRRRAQFLEVGLAAAAGDHERAASALELLVRDDDGEGFAEEHTYLCARARILCAAALGEDDLHARAIPLWERVLDVIDRSGRSGEEADRLLVVGGIAYGRFCVETGRLPEAEPWLRRAGARAAARGWHLASARATLERAAAAWAGGDHEATERLATEVQPVINAYARADDVARCWLYLGLVKMSVGELAAADDCWTHAERHWRELGRPLRIHRILVQRSWIPLFWGRYAEAVEMIAQAREWLDASPRSSWLQYARLDDHLGTVWRADALGDLGCDVVGDPDDTLAELEERHAASLGIIEDATPPDRQRSANAKFAQAAELKLPAAFAVDSVRYSLADPDARTRWASTVSAPMLAGAFAVATEWENTALLSEMIEYHSARGAFQVPADPASGGGLPDSAAAAVPLDDADAPALVAGGVAAHMPDPLRRLGPLPALIMEPGGSPVLEHYRDLARQRYGVEVTAAEPAWSTWP
jgi:tetratricopeptide (TPR) repeat protein